MDPRTRKIQALEAVTRDLRRALLTVCLFVREDAPDLFNGENRYCDDPELAQRAIDEARAFLGYPKLKRKSKAKRAA